MLKQNNVLNVSKSEKRCNCCDYCRQVLTLEECGLGVASKRNIRKRISETTVCVKPESPLYGECRNKKSAACNYYTDWFYKLDFGGNVGNARVEQARLVSKYRRECLGIEEPLIDNSGAGYAPV